MGKLVPRASIEGLKVLKKMLKVNPSSRFTAR